MNYYIKLVQLVGLVEVTSRYLLIGRCHSLSISNDHEAIPTQIRLTLTTSYKIVNIQTSGLGILKVQMVTNFLIFQTK